MKFSHPSDERPDSSRQYYIQQKNPYNITYNHLKAEDDLVHRQIVFRFPLLLDLFGKRHNHQIYSPDKGFIKLPVCIRL